MKTNTTTLSEFPIPDSLTTEIQIIADIISLPETLIDAERIITAEMFTDANCRDAFDALRAMAKGGMVIDLPSAYGRIDRGLIQKGVIPMMANVGGATSVIQHYAALKDSHIKRMCYMKAIELLTNVTGTTSNSQDLIGWAGNFADSLRKEAEVGGGIQHISAVLNNLGSQIEQKVKDKAEEAARKAIVSPLLETSVSGAKEVAPCSYGFLYIRPPDIWRVQRRESGHLGCKAIRR